MPKLLELFSGTGSIGRAFPARGWEVVSVDLDPKFQPTICCDIMELDEAALGHRNLEAGDRLVLRTLQIIENLRPRWWAFENPQTGLLKTRPMVQGLPYSDVCYCKYGFRRRPQGFGTTCPGRPRRPCAARTTAARPSRMASTPSAQSPQPAVPGATVQHAPAALRRDRGRGELKKMCFERYKALWIKHGQGQAIPQPRVHLEAAETWHSAAAALHRDLPRTQQEREDGRADQRDPGAVSHGGRFQRV